MTLAVARSRARSGVQAPEVRVEVFLGGGLPRLNIVGLPEAAVREASDRVHAAIVCAQFGFPQRRITVNLAPADLPKDGGRFDLPIAIGILAADGEISRESLDGCEMLGELALTGELRPVDGVLPAALAAARAGRALIVPEANGAEAALAGDVCAYTARTLLEVVAHLNGVCALPQALPPACIENPIAYPDLADIRGQFQARRALEVAAAGNHHLLLIGPPGCGKTLLATRLPGLLPQASEHEAIESAAIASLGGQGVDPATWRLRRFRAPHHTSSAIALVGGGADPRPGEVSLAHHGVLFLDELPEWERRALEVLREPLESGMVTISRAARQCEFPARFQLIAAMNPCPCGWAGDASGRCRCTPEAILRYRSRISGPLLDRIDLHLAVTRLAAHEIRPDAPRGETSAVVRSRVASARRRQIERAGTTNAQLSQVQTETLCALRPREQALLERAIEGLQLTSRATHRILRIARTIADLGERERIERVHLAEAIGYRQLDRLATTVQA